MDICFYCKKPNAEPSAEHVVADALGGCIELRAGDGCKTCNGVFDQQIDRAVQDDLRPILAQLEVPGKRGTTTRWTPTEIVDGEERRFNVTGHEVVAAEARKLLERQGNTYRFRTTSREELERARADIEVKNAGRTVQLSEVVERRPALPVARVDDVDFSLAHWSRWAAKTCLSVIGYTLGSPVALREEFDDLRARAQNNAVSVPAGLHHGGLGDDPAHVDRLRAEHRISVRAGSQGVQVCVTLFGFCGFTFSRNVPGLPSVERVIVLDAMERRVSTDIARDDAPRGTKRF
jgi:hypothetical protein